MSRPVYVGFHSSNMSSKFRLNQYSQGIIYSYNWYTYLIIATCHNIKINSKNSYLWKILIWYFANIMLLVWIRISQQIPECNDSIGSIPSGVERNCGWRILRIFQLNYHKFHLTFADIPNKIYCRGLPVRAASINNDLRKLIFPS